VASKNKAVFGIYRSGAEAEQAVDRLSAAGFSQNDISVLMPDRQSSKEFAHEKNTKVPEGATTGVTAGGVVGAALGLLAGIGALAIPGVGPLVAAGPIVASLVGLGAGGAVGGLIGALVGMGIPEYEAKRYEGQVKEGGILLSVHCDTAEEISKAKDLLKETGAEDISSAREESASSDGVGAENEPVAAEQISGWSTASGIDPIGTEATLRNSLPNGNEEREPAHHEIAELAYYYWINRNSSEGTAEDDWFRAKNQLQGNKQNASLSEYADVMDAH
jgi:hypothetical protein